MIKNYIKSALKNIRKPKGFSFINIIGLALIIAVFSIGYQVFQAARINPIQALKHE